MKSAVMSLGSKSSLMIIEAMKNYFDSVDSIDLRDVEVNLGVGKSNVLYEGKALPQYSSLSVKFLPQFGHFGWFSIFIQPFL